MPDNTNVLFRRRIQNKNLCTRHFVREARGG
jgi:hypothetical protein